MYNRDVVLFFEKHSKKSGGALLSVNILEAAMKGTMYNDEPCAPLQFLLSPRFLGSDLARIAMYCVVKCVPYMPSSQMTEMLLMVFLPSLFHYWALTLTLTLTLVPNPNRYFHIMLYDAKNNRPSLVKGVTLSRSQHTRKSFVCWQGIHTDPNW